MTLAKHAFYAVAIAVLCNVSAQVALKMGATTEAVSYTHLDVYKRQPQALAGATTERARGTR